jgi:hypothetical protein
MWIRVGQKFGIACRRQPTVQVRKHGRNMSKNADRMRTAMETVLGRARDAAVVPRVRVDFWSKVWAVHYFQCAWMLYDEGRSAEALRCATLAFLVRPLPLSAGSLGEPPLFRLRAWLRFFRAEAVHGFR